MEEIRDEDRIISRILNGELSFSDKDIKDLASANLSKEREEKLVQLATEIQEKVKHNNELRKEVEERAQLAEKDTLTKLDLYGIEEDLRNLHKDLDQNEIKEFKNLTTGVIATVGFGILMPLIVSIFTNALIPLLLTLFVGVNLGILPTVLAEKKILNQKKQTKQKIKELEQERIKLLEYKSEIMNEHDVERTKNAAKQVYSKKELEMTEEELLSLL